MAKKPFKIAIGGLILITQMVFVANKIEQNVNAQSQPAEQNKFENKSVIKPSEILQQLREKKKANPSISAKELAAFGNEIIKSNGYDYTFSWEPKGKQNEVNLGKTNYKDYLPFEYQFTAVNGKSQKFQLLNNGFEHPCYSVIDVPVTKVNEQTITVTSEGKEIELKRPKDFYLEEFVLVDKLKKPIRKWKTPIDAYPVGISEDGKKIYFEDWEFSQDSSDNYKESPINLAVEISENGSLRLVDTSEIKSGKGQTIDYDKKAPEIQYEKYKIGKNEFIVKYSSPCT